ncbi:hypothetical protein Goarm_011312 [Gossypium armourianum]|uniref:Uncharacterized protein n=1 Tax=Gossypium armourianum TaxID=34283 RepID=A0A7J9IWF6_9ROSI|nr:hypothetical protein [Gossypium armourianum]
MDLASITKKPLSWKDRLIGTGLQAEGQTTTSNAFSDEGEFELSKIDVVCSLVNGILLISFSERIAMHMYKRRILWEIGGLVGKVAKLDFNMDNGVRGRANEPKESEESVAHGEGEQTRNTTSNTDDLPKNSDGYGPWILVERRGRRPPRTTKRSGSQDPEPTNNSRFHALETLADDEGTQEQGSGLETETGQRKTGPDVSHVMKEAGLSHIVRVRGKGETYLVHGGGALTEERIFPSLLESDVVEQMRSNREEHAQSTVFVGERGEEATKEKRLAGVVMEASSHSSQQSRPDGLQEVMMSIMKDILDSSQCSVVAFKGNICLDSSTGSPVGRLGAVGHRAVQGILRAEWGKSSGNG